MNIIGYKNYYLIFSGILVVASLITVSLWGFNLGIDFTGGSLMQIKFQGKTPSAAEITDALKTLSIGDISVTPIGTNEALIKFQHVDENTHQGVLSKISSISGVSSVSEESFTSIGPVIGQELEKNSLIAIGFALFAIAIYIAWAFRKVSQPVASYKYGIIAAIVAVFHDVAIPTGVFAALGHFFNVPIDTLFITALLTILGFSVHDTIVVFDRIRENLRKLKQSENFETTVNRSVNETLGRSINTSLSVLLVLLVIFFVGGDSTRYFSLALILGILFGTYSSIFVASPLLVILGSKSTAKKK